MARRQSRFTSAELEALLVRSLFTDEQDPDPEWSAELKARQVKLKTEEARKDEQLAEMNRYLESQRVRFFFEHGHYEPVVGDLLKKADEDPAWKPRRHRRQAALAEIVPFPDEAARK